MYRRKCSAVRGKSRRGRNERVSFNRRRRPQQPVRRLFEHRERAGFKLASRPADPEHPYGHGRYEYLSGLAVAVLVLLVAVELIKSSIDKIVNPTQVEFSLALVAVLTLSILVKCWMAAFNRSLGNKIDSETLIATAQDSTNDCIATGAVLLSAVVARVTSLQLDAWAASLLGHISHGAA